MAQRYTFRKGMQVYGPDDRPLGPIENFDNESFTFRGRRFGSDAISRLERDRIYLNDTTYRGLGNLAEGEGTIRVPVVEERLDVEKRAVQTGEVGIRKEVTEERVNIPVETMREEVRVERVDVPERPVKPGEIDTAFREGTIRVPVRAEQAFVEKEAVVTGEVVVNKERQTERQTVSDTVRKEHVDVDEDYKRYRPEFERHFAARQSGMGRWEEVSPKFRSRWEQRYGKGGERWETYEPRYRYAYEMAYNPRYQGRRWNEVESDLRRDWETRYRDQPWDRVKDSIRDAWENMTDAVGAKTGQTRAVGGTTTRSFTDAEPNYRYGYTAARDPKYQGRRFNEVEPDLRRNYETAKVGGGRTWDDVREEVEEAFDRINRS